MIKKLISLLIVAAICLSFAGCGDDAAIEDIYGRRNRVYLKVSEINSKNLTAEAGTVEKDPRITYDEYRDLMKQLLSSQSGAIEEETEVSTNSSTLEDTSSLVGSEPASSEAPSSVISSSDTATSSEHVRKGEMPQPVIPILVFEGYEQTVQVKNDDDIEFYKIENEVHTVSKWESIKKGDILRVEFDDGEIDEIYILKDCLAKVVELEPDENPDFDNGKAEHTVSKNKTLANSSFNTKKSDTNALRINKAAVTITNVTINKTGDSDEYQDALEFGKNAAFLIQQSAKVKLKDSEVLSKAEGSSGLFIYGNKTTAECDQMIISTAGEYSPAAISKGKLLAFSSCEIIAKNERSSALEALLGTMRLNDCRASTYGTFSPTVLVKSVFEAKNSSFTAQSSEVLKIVGGSAELDDCSLSGTRENFQDVTDKNLYTVMVNDGALVMKGCTFKNVNNDLFKISKNSRISLENMSVFASNGSFASLNDQAFLDLTLTDTATDLTFSCNGKADVCITLNGYCDVAGIANSAESPITLSITANDQSLISLSGDTYLASFEGELSSVRANGFKLFVAGKQVI